MRVPGVPPKWKGFPQNVEKMKVLKMGLPIVESFSGLHDNVCSLFRNPNSGLVKRVQKMLNIHIFPIPPISPR